MFSKSVDAAITTCESMQVERETIRESKEEDMAHVKVVEGAVSLWM